MKLALLQLHLLFTPVYKPSGNNTESSLSFRNILVDNNYIHDHKGPVSVRDMNNSAITNNFCKTGATVSLPQGTTGFFNFNIDNVVFEGNQMDGIPNTGSADQCWIDNEAYCNNVRIFGNLIKNTAGPGVEFLALGNGANPPRGQMILIPITWLRVMYSLIMEAARWLLGK